MLTGILLAGTSALLVDERSLVIVILELVAAGLAIGAENATVPRLLEDVAYRYFEDPFWRVRALEP